MYVWELSDHKAGLPQNERNRGRRSSGGRAWLGRGQWIAQLTRPAPRGPCESWTRILLMSCQPVSRQLWTWTEPGCKACTRAYSFHSEQHAYFPLPLLEDEGETKTSGLGGGGGRELSTFQGRNEKAAFLWALRALKCQWGWRKIGASLLSVAVFKALSSWFPLLFQRLLHATWLWGKQVHEYLCFGWLKSIQRGFLFFQKKTVAASPSACLACKSFHQNALRWDQGSLWLDLGEYYLRSIPGLFCV